MNQYVEIVICSVNSVLMIYILNLFFSSISKPNYNWQIHVITLCVLSMLHIAILYKVTNTILNLCLFILITYAISFLYNLKWYAKILFVLTVTAISNIAELSTNFLFVLGFDIDFQETMSGIFLILGILLSKMILFLMILLIRTKVRRSLYANSPQKIMTILLIPLSSIMMILLVYYCLMQLEAISDPLAWGVLICCSLYIAFNYVVFYFVERIYDDAQKDIELSVARGIITKQSEQYTQLLESNREIRAIRHDYNNFTTGLISEIEKGNYDIALEELYKLKHSFNESTLLSNNIGIVHLIVDQKIALARESDITIDFEYHDLSKIKISDIDLAIILGNALDNAIEASRLLPLDIERKIYLNIKMHNSNISVLIKNNVVENVDVNNLVTTKKSKDLHGFGIESMRQLVEKYRGELIFNCQNLVFETYIVLTNINDQASFLDE